MAKRKVTVVGAGNVGGTTAQRLAERNYADVVLVDIIEGLPQGKALDILESGPIVGYDSNVTGANDYEQTAGSDVVVITSGSPRKPGMSRDDLLKTNQNIVASVTEEVVKYSPEAILVVVANPLDAMCHVAMETSGFPRERVVGMAGILDTARYRTFIAEELGVSVRDVFALVLGGHGDTMVPLPSMATVGGVAITELLPDDRVEAIVERTRQGGAEIVGLLQSGSAFYAPSAAAAEMVDAIVLPEAHSPLRSLPAGRVRNRRPLRRRSRQTRRLGRRRYHRAWSHRRRTGGSERQRRRCKGSRASLTRLDTNKPDNCSRLHILLG